MGRSRLCPTRARAGDPAGRQGGGPERARRIRTPQRTGKRQLHACRQAADLDPGQDPAHEAVPRIVGRRLPGRPGRRRRARRRSAGAGPPGRAPAGAARQHRRPVDVNGVAEPGEGRIARARPDAPTARSRSRWTWVWLNRPPGGARLTQFPIRAFRQKEDPRPFWPSPAPPAPSRSTPAWLGSSPSCVPTTPSPSAPTSPSYRSTTPAWKPPARQALSPTCARPSRPPTSSWSPPPNTTAPFPGCLANAIDWLSRPHGRS